MAVAELGAVLLVDTNVVIRYLTGDPRPDAARAADLFQSERRIVLSPLILAECGYVLKSRYAMPRDVIVDALSELVKRVNVDTLWLPKLLVLEAFEQCRGSNRVSFTDALLWAEARDLGAGIATFDRRFPDQGVELERLG